MGIDFSKLGQNLADNVSAASNEAASKGKAQEREPSEFYVNVGIEVPMPKADGSVENVFVALGLGIPLDYVRETKAGTDRNPEWAALAEAKNWLLDQVRAGAAELAPGEALVVPGLQAQIKRVAAKVAPSTTGAGNPFLAALSAKLGGH